MDSGVGNDLKCFSSGKKSKQLIKYSWTRKSSTNQSSSWLDDLLKAEIISGKELLVLKERNLITYDPKVVMDLRHEQVKRNRQLNSNHFSKYDIREEARRFIRSEDRKAVLHKKEQMLIDKEIGLLKQQLDKIKVMIKHESHNQTILKSTTNVIVKQDDLCNNSVSENSNVRCAEKEYEFELQCQEANDVLTSQSESTIHGSALHENNGTISSEEVPLVGDVEENTRPEIEICKYTDQHLDMIECATALAKQVLLQSTLKKWISYTVAQRKFAEDRSHKFETDSKHLLAKYWQVWRSCAVQSHQRHNIRHSEKIIKPENIEKFIKSLQEKKLQVQNCNREKSQSKNRICTGSPQMKINNKLGKKMVDKSSTSVGVNEHRLTAQNTIIAVQKAEIEKQNQLIEELRLANLKLEAEKSCAEASSNLKEVQSSCHIALKAKASALVRGLSVLSSEVSDSANHSSAIVSRMEERQKERQRRWQLIKEKKKCIEEERREKLLKEEAERKQKEDEEKMLKIMQYKEKRRIEKENELKRQIEREKLKELYHKAIEHYNRHLLRKYGMGGWLALIDLRRCQMNHAVVHYQSRLLHHYFHKWRQFALQSAASKMGMACAHYERKLLQQCFCCFLMVYDDGIRHCQVASDFYELKLMERTFSCWHQWICDQHLDWTFKYARAAEHAQRRLLASCLSRWQQFPRLMQLDREKEQRKFAWRRKVQELLPDFRPPSST